MVFVVSVGLDRMPSHDLDRANPTSTVSSSIYNTLLWLSINKIIVKILKIIWKYSLIYLKK